MVIIYWLQVSIPLGDIASGLGEQEVICTSINPLKVMGKARKLLRVWRHNLAVSTWTQCYSKFHF
jgi:hypothetical protein